MSSNAMWHTNVGKLFGNKKGCSLFLTLCTNDTNYSAVYKGYHIDFENPTKLAKGYGVNARVGTSLQQ